MASTKDQHGQSPDGTHDDLANLLEAFRALPPIESGTHDIRPPNAPILVYDGPFTLIQGQTEVHVIGKIRQHWLPTPRVHFEAPVTSSEWLDVTAVTIRVPGRLDATGLVTLNSPFTRVSGVLHGNVRFGTDDVVDSVRFYLPNFVHYVGSAVRTGTSERPGGALARLDLTAPPWAIVIDQQNDHTPLVQELRREGGYGVGHVGRITRLDGKPFQADDAAEIRGALYIFSLFMSGRRSGPIILTGFDGNTERWTEWGAWDISQWEDVLSWFPLRVDSSEVNRAFHAYWSLWQRPEWHRPLRELLQWYVEANMNTTGIEGSLLLSHTALELLAWVRLVIDGPHEPKPFDATYTSAQRIAMLLTELGIPVVIPEQLAALRLVADEHGWTDGAQAISTFRNWLVHPQPKNRERFEGAKKPGRWEALQLAAWYLEMALLRVFEYRGEYQSRLRLDRVRGDCELVPWA